MAIKFFSINHLFHVEISIFRALNKIGKDIRIPALTATGIFIFSLIFNTSFSIMGVNITEFAGSFLNDFFFTILKANIAVWFAWTVFFTALSLPLLHFLFLDKKFYFITVFSILLILLLHSMTKYPQLYGEFYYLRYPSLLPVLHFLTDYTSPTLFSAILVLICISLVLLFFFKKNSVQLSTEKQFVFTYTLLFFSFHIYETITGQLFLILAWSLLRNKHKLLRKWKQYTITGIASFLLLLPLVSSFIIKIIPPLYNNYNVVLLVADSLRFDSISKRLHDKSITPNIDKLMQTSWSFMDHNVTIPRTFPSWADTLTGQYAMTHKIRDMFPAPDEKKNIGMGSRYLTIGHQLQKKGYHTGVISGFAGDIFPRVDFGFQEVITPTFNANVLAIHRILESQILFLPILTGSLLGGGKYIRETDGLPTLGDDTRYLSDISYFMDKNRRNPFFLTFFSSVTHFPYSPPWPWYKKYGNASYYGKYKYLKFVDPSDSSIPSPMEIEQIRLVFDRSVSAFDDSVGRILSLLEEKGIKDNTIIIVTGDHGESLYEDIHGHGHGEHLRGEHVLHVPLIIKLPPKLETQFGLDIHRPRFEGITSSVDLLPTLQEILNLDRFDSPGRSLVPVFGKNRWMDDRKVYAETGIWFSDRGNHFFQQQRVKYPNIMKLHRVVEEENNEIMITDPFYRTAIPFAKHRALLSSQFKLIYIPTNDGILYEFYDRKKDPLNKSNLYFNNPQAYLFKNQLFTLVTKNENAKVVGDYLLPPPF